MDFGEALKIYKNDPYKTELINDLKEAGEKKVSFYKSGDFDNDWIIEIKEIIENHIHYKHYMNIIKLGQK
jgi:threonyl-tRNA synthetase